MLEIAIDIGGTFTDIVCLQDQQRLCLAKVPTTPHDLVQGMQQGVARVLALAGQPATAVERFIHSTTIATHAILSRLYLSGRQRWKSPPYPSHSLRHYGH